MFGKDTITSIYEKRKHMINKPVLNVAVIIDHYNILMMFTSIKSQQGAFST